MCYIVFISHSLHWLYIKIALQEYVIILDIYCQNKDIADFHIYGKISSENLEYSLAHSLLWQHQTS